MKTVTRLRLSLLLLLPTVALSGQDSVVFKVTPEKCVSLHKGQTCYQELHISWKSGEPDDFCLYISGQDKPLKCWQHTSEAEYRFEFQSSESRMLTFKLVDQPEPLASSIVEVKWVYQKQRSLRGGWRMF